MARWGVRDLRGSLYGQLRVIEKVGKDASGHIIWSCHCSCGNDCVKQGSELRRTTRTGVQKSCGCLGREVSKANFAKRLIHGFSTRSCRAREYDIWQAMKQRCLNPKARWFSEYGGRGIKVCDRWIESYLNFIADMGKRPSPELSLDRINNDGDYEPNNCRWATKSQQIHNRRPVHQWRKAA